MNQVLGNTKSTFSGSQSGGFSAKPLFPPLGKKEEFGRDVQEAEAQITKEELKRRKRELKDERKRIEGIFSFKAANEAKELYTKLDRIAEKSLDADETKFESEISEFKEMAQEAEQELRKPRAGFEPQPSPVSTEKKEAIVPAGAGQGFLVQFFGYQASQNIVNNSKRLAEKGDVRKASTWLAGLVLRLFKMRELA